MSLTTRLLVFFLGTLALVLAGFSTTLYLLARTYFTRQTEERLRAALDTLTAAVEATPDGLEWEVHERTIPIGLDGGDDQVRWRVCDDQGHEVERSRNLADGAWDPAWEVVQRRLDAPQPGTVTAIPSNPGEPKYRALLLTVGVSLRPVRATLRTLALASGGLSLLLWLLAALTGRALCRRALAPVTRMAAAARAITAPDAGERLPAAGTGDELEDLGRAFNDLLGRLGESFARQRRFTGDASHQLRTPLTVILGQVEVALRRERPPEEYRRVLELTRRQTEHLRHIVEMLLFLARADAEADLSALEPLELNGWLSGHVAGWSAHTRAADFRVETEAEPSWVKAHPPLLGQLLDSLLENACKYSDPGTPILFRVEAETDRAVLAVEDRGCGIDSGELPHVFEPFYRSPTARRRDPGGVGLGLAVVARIAAALGGWVVAKSQPGQGSRFQLELPRPAPNPGGPATT
jgi:signal transduction histidine kinase